jgi:glycosyltransferase involved in cell wall biosynthesis
MRTRPSIVIFDMAVEKLSPAGSCVLTEVIGLAENFDVTVFSNRCDAMNIVGVEWVYIPLPRKPILFRYWLYHLLAPLAYMFWRLSGKRATYVQGTQGQFVGADVVYAHFCHRAYLKGQWRESTVTGIRRLARWLNHSFNAFFERLAINRAKKIVVPSHGLARELSKEYPDVANRIITIANPVDIVRFSRPDDFDRQVFRSQLGVKTGELALSFVALGDFARKGLGLLIAAIARLSDAQRSQLRLIVIGGQPSEIESFRQETVHQGIGDRVVLVGMQGEVRDFLWATDAYVFPSAYEIFSLAILQAAAAGLPVLVSERLYGAEEYIRDGYNGWVVQRTEDGVTNGLERLISDRNKFPHMAAMAVQSVQGYSMEVFQKRWIQVYSSSLALNDVL